MYERIYDAMYERIYNAIYDAIYDAIQVTAYDAVCDENYDANYDALISHVVIDDDFHIYESTTGMANTDGFGKLAITKRIERCRIKTSR